MTEVLRSKLFYARSASMIAIPTFNHFASLPDTDQGILKHLLAAASKPRIILASSDALLAQVTVESILLKGRYSSREYFGRAWTLAGETIVI